MCSFRRLLLVVVDVVVVVVVLVAAAVAVVEWDLVRSLRHSPTLRHRRVPRVSRDDVHVA